MGDKAKLPTILGREVAFKEFNDTQLVLIHRMRQMLAGTISQLPGEDEDIELTDVQRRALSGGLDVAARFLDMLGYMVVEDEDRDWLTQQMLAGNLDLAQIAKFVMDLVPDDKKDKAPVKKAARAR